jgi:hypothetical protein
MDEIGQEKQRISERLARLDDERVLGVFPGPATPRIALTQCGSPRPRFQR